MSSLSPCSYCHRHIEAGAADCPFCGARSERAAAVARPAGSGRLSRAAVFAAGATLVGMAAACSSSTTGADGGTGTAGAGGAGGTVSPHGGAGGTASTGTGGTVASAGASGEGGESGRGGSTGASGGPTDGSTDSLTVAIYSAPFPPAP
jgi:hypothetical protein